MSWPFNCRSVVPGLRRFASRKGGNVGLVFAFSLPLVIGGAGFGVETSYWYVRALHLQSAADNAAYAGALEKRAGSGSEVVTSTATQTATKNGFSPAAGTITVHSPPTSGAYQSAQAVEVILSEPERRFFTGLFSNAAVIAHARAVAVFQTASNACILALDPTASQAASFSGNASVTLTGCSVMANSTASNAIYSQGSAQLTAGCLISGGGVQLNSNTHVTQCSAPVLQAPPVADPYASVPAPADSGSCRPSNGATLQPGRYCGGLSLSGAVTLNPGVYVISSGDFKVNANANISGSGVTIYLSGSGRVSINGNATVNLTAPTSGTYAGILFMGDRANSGGTANKFNGTAASRLTGAMYFASQEVDYLGNFSGLNGCSQIVAATIAWSGNTSVATDCSQYGIRNIPAQQIVQVVE